MEYRDYLDYTDDLTVLACTQAQIRVKTDKVCQACDAYEARNQLAENESEVHQHQLRCTSQAIQTTIKKRRLQ